MTYAADRGREAAAPGDMMALQKLRGLFRTAQRTLPELVAPDELVNRILLRVSVPAPSFAPEENALGATSLVFQSRSALALNLLRLRAARDIAAVPVLTGYLRRAFGTEDFGRVAAALQRGMMEKSGRIAQADVPDLARRLEESVNAAAFFQEVEAILDQGLGVTEKPTETTFDEAGYLAANPDVAAAVARGETPSGRKHWRTHGAVEGRVQRLFGKGHGASLAYPLRFVKDEHSNSPVGDPLAVAPEATPGPLYIILPLSQAEEHDASPSFSAATSVGHDCPAFDDLLARRNWTSPPLYIASFENACADVVNGIMIFGGDKVWGDSAWTTLLSPGADARAPDIFRLGDAYAWRRDADLQEEAPSGATWMLFTSWASRANYGHWLVNSLFSVYLVLDALRGGRLKLLCPPLEAHHRQHLATLGAPLQSIHETKARYVRAERLLYPSPLTTSANIAPPTRAVEFFDFARRRFAPRMPAAGPKYVFLSRQGFPSARRMTNEDALCEALRRIGFHVARPHDMTLGEQIVLMSHARVAVGQFGAALWNTAFMPQGGEIVEIATSNYVSNEYLYVARLMGARLHRVMIDASRAQGGQNDGGLFEFEAPVAEIVALARSLM